MSKNESTNKTVGASTDKAKVIVKKVLSAILYGIFAIVFIVVLWLGIDKFILKSPVPSMFGYSTLTIETGSMQSTLNVGDLIVIKDTDDYKIGDIVTYMREGDKIPTTHRIIYYEGEGVYTTKGDANNTKDMDVVTDDMIIGEVIKVYRKAGLFSKWVKAEGWMYIAVVFVMIALGAFILKSDEPQNAEEGSENSGNNNEADTAENKSESTENELKNVENESEVEKIDSEKSN